MRTVTAAVAVLSFSLMLTVPALAEELLLAKVYRDYPGYINPAVCENPNLGQPAAAEPAAKPASVSTEAVKSPAVPAPAQPAASQSAEPVVKEAPVVKSPPAVVEPKAVAPAAEVSRQCEPVPYGMQSDDPVGVPYVSAWAGFVATQDTDADPDIEVTFDNGFGGGLAVGYDFGPARLEVEAAYRKSDIDEVTIGAGEVAADGELEVQTLMLNGFADFRTGGNLTPYLGAGIGYAKVELGDDDDSVLAGQLAAGVLIAISPAVAIDLGYRFMMTDDPKIDDTEFEVRQHTASIGLQFRF